MHLQAVACQTADAWQESATSAAARLSSPDGFFTVQLAAADAAIVQAALTVAALALDTQLHRDPAIGKVLVKVRPGSAPCPGLNIYEQAAAVLDTVARTVLPLLLRGMGLRSDALSSVLDDIPRPSTVTSSSEIHVTRYRGPVDGFGTALAAGGAPMHVDQSVLTVIAADTVHGLEVTDGQGGRAVPLGPGQVAVLCGHTLEFATGGVLRATQHHVKDIRTAACLPVTWAPAAPCYDDMHVHPSQASVPEVQSPRTALAYKFKANADATIDLSHALRAAGASCSGLEHPMRVSTYSRQFHAEHSSINADEQGSAVRILPVEALIGGSAVAPAAAPVPARQSKRRADADPDGLSHGAHRHRTHTRGSGLTLFVILPNEGTVPFTGLSAQSSVKHIKVRIQDKAGYPLDQQNLVFDGCRLRDEWTLANYAIEHEDTVVMCLTQVGD